METASWGPWGKFKHLLEGAGNNPSISYTAHSPVCWRKNNLVFPQTQGRKEEVQKETESGEKKTKENGQREGKDKESRD